MATGTISSVGIGSGLDANAIISKLMDIEKQPLLQVQSQASAISAKISAFGTIQSDLSALGDAARKLKDPATWSATLATSSDSTAVTVASGSTAAAGSYAVSVQNLASAQSSVSPAYLTADSTVGAGTLSIQLGSLDSGPPTAFNARSTLVAMNITVLSTDTLTTVQNKINASGAGVSASIVTDQSGARLVISASNTGTQNAFKITTDDGHTDGTGLSALAVDPTQEGASTAVPSSITQKPADAEATINGLQITSASNTLTNVVQGLTLNLLKKTTVDASPGVTASTTNVQLSVSPDTASMKTAVQGLVTAYNALANEISTDTAYDAANKVSSVLTGDSTATSMERQLRSILGASSSASSIYSTLSAAGVQFQQDPSTKQISLKIDDTKLGNTLSNVAEAKKLFSASGDTDSSADGFAQRISAYTDAMLSFNGGLTTRTAGLKTQLDSNQKRQDDLSTRNDATQARLQAQYTALDSKMATLTALSSYVTQQITNWNKSTA